MINRNNVIRKFEKMGAKLGFAPTVNPRGRPRGGLTVDVLNQGRPSETFAINADADVELQVLDLRLPEQHLLLMARRAESGEILGKYLCGHDERHWFVAGVEPSTTNVRTALESLKPAAVRQRQKAVRPNKRNRRHNPAFVRQGEWFFLSARDFDPGPSSVLQNEPLIRGRGKPHVAEELVRFGGDRVYLTERYPSGISEARYRRVLASNPASKSWSWRVMVRNPKAFVRGAIRHPDHKTVVLKHWYRVEVSAEVFSETVAFLD